jgi:hypothetical protein
VNPLLALALLLAAGLAATHLRLPHLRHSLSLDVAVAAGAPLVLVGLLLGPGLGVLDPPTRRALAPITALGIGWIGAVFGAQLESRLLRRIPPRVWAFAALRAGAILLVTVLTARLLTRLVPALASAWRPTIPALLTIAGAAMISGAVIGRKVRRAALLDTAFGVLVFALGLGLSHPHRPFHGVALGWVYWVAVAIVSSGGVGVLFLWVSRLRERIDPQALGLDLLGVILVGAGLGYATDLSPFVVCALATALIVNLSPLKRRVQALLVAWEPPIYAVFLVAATALFDLPTLWLVPAVLLLGVLRVAARWAAVRYGRVWLSVPGLPPHFGLATVAQGGVPLALAVSFNLIYVGAGDGGAVLTTVLLGVAFSQALALLPRPTEVS